MEWTVDKLVMVKTINLEGINLIKMLLLAKNNILVIGSPGVGKTTLIKTILETINPKKNIALIRGVKLEWEDSKHNITYYDTVDEFVNHMRKYSLVIIDWYTLDVKELKKVKIPMIVLIRDKKIESRLPYLGRDLIDAVIKMRLIKREYCNIDPINPGIIHIVDTIKLYDPYLGTYSTVYYWDERGGKVLWSSVNKYLHIE